jgi:hypothetical protein
MGNNLEAIGSFLKKGRLLSSFAETVWEKDTAG